MTLYGNFYIQKEIGMDQDPNKKIYDLALQLSQLREQKKEAEEHVKKLNEEIKKVEEKTLAPLMDEQLVSKISINDLDISKSLVYRGGCTKHYDKDAFKYLFDSNNEGALKQLLIVDYAACPLADAVLTEAGIPFTTEYSIHHATLSSILKELVESGKFSTEDIEKYSVYIQPQIKVKRNN